MELLDSAGAIGELVSWLGLLLGLPFLVVSWALRLRDGDWLPVEVVVVPVPGGAIARWFAGGDFHERHLGQDERDRLGEGDHQPAYVAERRPWRMEVEPHSPAARTMRIIGLVLVVLGLVGLAVSFLPMLA